MCITYVYIRARADTPHTHTHVPSGHINIGDPGESINGVH